MSDKKIKRNTNRIQGKVGRGNQKRYSIIDTTADIGIKAYGMGLSEIFESCALGMFDLISDISKVDAKGELKIVLEAQDIEMLLVDFLNRFLYYKDTWNYVFASCKVNRIAMKNGNYMLDAIVSGEVFQKGKHIVGKDVKAATYHMLEINEKDGYATIIFDI